VRSHGEPFLDNMKENRLLAQRGGASGVDMQRKEKGGHKCKNYVNPLFGSKSTSPQDLTVPNLMIRL